MGRRRSSPESTPTSPHDYARWLVGNGYIRGLMDRAIVPFIVGHKDEAHSSIHCWPAIKTRPVGYYFLYWTAVHR